MRQLISLITIAFLAGCDPRYEAIAWRLGADLEAMTAERARADAQRAREREQFLENERNARNDCVHRGGRYQEYVNAEGVCNLPAAPAPQAQPTVVAQPQADWATQQRCRRYAEGAVSDYFYNTRMDCNFGGARWQENVDAHYDWCLKVSRDAALSEDRARSAQLEQCRKAREVRID